MSTEFSAWLDATSKAIGFRTNTALANALGVPQPTVSRWKSGSQPSVDHLVKVSRLVGIHLEHLLVLAGYMDAEPNAQAPELQVRLPEGHVAVSADDVLTVLHGPISAPEAFMAAAKRLHLACLVDAEIVEEDNQ